MEFKRTLHPAEITLLGDNPQHRLHAIIDAALKSMRHAGDTNTIEGRILSLMSATPMNARDILNTHNAIYGNNAVTLAYVRFNIIGMYQAGLITRVSRGMYSKVNKEDRLAAVESQIMGIEMTGKVSNNKRYKALQQERRELS